MIFKRDNSCNNTINLLLQITECVVIFRGLIKGLQELHVRETEPRRMCCYGFCPHSSFP